LDTQRFIMLNGSWLSPGILKAALRTGLSRTRHETTSFPRPIPTRAVAIRSGTHSVFGCIKELFGVEMRVVLGWKNEANGSLVLLRCIVCATHCDIRIGGSPTNPSFLSAIITSFECRISGESPRGAYDKSALNSS
jgi:hypothetical protein